jgi:hypothetical protein
LALVYDPEAARMTILPLTLDTIRGTQRTSSRIVGQTPDPATAMGAPDALSNKSDAAEASLAPVLDLSRLTDTTVGDMVKSQEEAPAESASKPKQRDPTEIFLKYMKMSVAERYVEDWLAAHNLSKEDLAAMSPKERQAVMKRMEEDIKRKIKEETEKRTGVPLPATPDLSELLAKG